MGEWVEQKGYRVSFRGHGVGGTTKRFALAASHYYYSIFSVLHIHNISKSLSLSFLAILLRLSSDEIE